MMNVKSPVFHSSLVIRHSSFVIRHSSFDGGGLMAGVLWRALNLLMVALFLLAVAVQYNDPDPIRWMSIYGMAAVACGLSYRDKLHWSIPAATGLVALIWAATIAPRVVG